MEDTKICNNCGNDYPLILFNIRKDSKGKNSYYRSWCIECERDTKRTANQLVMKAELEAGNPNIFICTCGKYYAKHLKDRFGTHERGGCKPCLRVKKLEKNLVFQEAKKLLMQYASDKLAVQKFLKRFGENND